jgi:prepilin-type processing-associated H-X9-DG protein
VITYSNWHSTQTADGGAATGLFWIDKRIRPDQINQGDGIGNTILAAENDFAGRFAVPVYRENPPNTNPRRQSEFEMCEVAFFVGDEGVHLQGESGVGDDQASPTSLAVLNTDLDHFKINYGVQNRGAKDGWLPAPNSSHGEGVHVMFADGRVTFLNESLNEAVYVKLLTWNGQNKGEGIVNPSSYE